MTPTQRLELLSMNMNKNCLQQPVQLIAKVCMYWENPTDFLNVRFPFAKLVAETRNEIIYKTVTPH